MNTQEPAIAVTPDTPMSLAEASQICFLDPQKLKFSKVGAVLQLTVAGEKPFLKTIVSRVFPLSHPGRYLSVRDGDGGEVGIIRSLDDLDSDSRRLVEAELSRRYFMPVIHRIRKVIERFGTVEWHVDTDRGPCRFTTRDLREKVLRLDSGRYVLQDVDENRYEIPNTSRLDTKSLLSLLRHL
jgi:hypothetical protein